jgi:hypothetical protein
VESGINFYVWEVGSISVCGKWGQLLCVGSGINFCVWEVGSTSVCGKWGQLLCVGSGANFCVWEVLCLLNKWLFFAIFQF